MNPGGEWSDTAHRPIRIDRLAPEVTLVRDPLDPDGNQGWYTVPVAVTANVTDTGSGVAAVEISADGTTWQPYTATLSFTNDTPETTIFARASDGAGHVSEPVSTTLKIDLSAPDSDSSDDCEAGVCNGGVWERTSGLAGMEIQVDGGSWTSASILGEALPTLWAYAALLDVGSGYHIVYGRAADGAGHVEAPHLIAERIWYPWASPDLSASSLAFEPAVARPGETVTATLTVRNGGFQEGYVAIQATLPAGLAPAGGVRSDGHHLHPAECDGVSRGGCNWAEPARRRAAATTHPDDTLDRRRGRCARTGTAAGLVACHRAVGSGAAPHPQNLRGRANLQLARDLGGLDVSLDVELVQDGSGEREAPSGGIRRSGDSIRELNGLSLSRGRAHQPSSSRTQGSLAATAWQSLRSAVQNSAPSDSASAR